MKIIDEKGRLFGKVNIIDFLVVLFLCVLVFVFYSAYKIVTKEPPVEPKEFLEFEIPCDLIKIKPEVLALIAIGDRETDEKNNTVGEIIWVGESKPAKYLVNLGSNEKYEVDDPTLRQLPVKLKIKTEKRLGDNNIYNIFYNNQKISIGEPFRFTTNKYAVEVIPNLPTQKEAWVEIKVKFSAISPEINKLISEGYIEKDKKGRIIGRLNKIVSIHPSQVQALKVEEGKFIFVTDPLRNDVVAILEILCTKKEGSLYFKDFSVKTGTQMTFVSELYVISGEVIGIEKINAEGSD